MSTDERSVPSSYRGYEEEARELVKMIIQRSIEIVIAAKIEAPPIVDVAWPTGGEFTVEKGEAAINKLVENWLVGHSWKYCINYLHHKKGVHCYAVKYSEPTRRKPVPRATVSVYFYLCIQRKDVPVLVKFVVEGQRTPLTPKDTVFHEKWLRSVIRNKISVMDAARKKVVTFQ